MALNHAVTSMVTFAAFASTALGQSTFTPVRELPGIIEPPALVDAPYEIPHNAVNAGEALSGFAPHFVLNHYAGRSYASITTDFVNITHLAEPSGCLSSIAVAAARSGWPIVGGVDVVALHGHQLRACMWTDENTFIVLPASSGPGQQSAGISRDGSRWAVHTGYGLADRSFLIADGESHQVIPVEGDDAATATRISAISPSGDTLAGDYNGGNGTLFIQHIADGMPGTPEFINTDLPEPLLVSDGGNVVVTAECVLQRVGPTFRLRPSQPYRAMTPNGRLVVGTNDRYHPLRAVIWTSTLEQRDLGDELTARGVNLRGWRLESVEWVSDDGRRLIGLGVDPAGVRGWWVVTTDGFAPADMGRAGGLPGSDGRVDNNDFIAFIDAFFQQSPRADTGKAGGELGPDGQLDANDFIAFISMFFDGVP